MPRLQGAVSVDDIVDALQPRRTGVPYDPRTKEAGGGWLGSGRRTITANGAAITDRDALRAALAGALHDPSLVTLQWHQGLEENKRGNLETVLNNAVRQQLALIRAAEGGDERALYILRLGRGVKAEHVLRYDVAPGLYRRSNAGIVDAPDAPPTVNPDADWARVKQLIDAMRAAGMNHADLDSLYRTANRMLVERGEWPGSDQSSPDFHEGMAQRLNF
jgi:hypothetical protein